MIVSQHLVNLDPISNVKGNPIEGGTSVLVTNKYELLVIVNPELSEEELEALLQRVRGYLAEADATVFSFKEWGLRRLAYTLKGHKEGRYYLVHFAMNTSKVAAFEHSILLAEGILRELITRLEDEFVIEEPQEPVPAAPEVVSEPEPESDNGVAPEAGPESDNGEEVVEEAEGAE